MLATICSDSSVFPSLL